MLTIRAGKFERAIEGAQSAFQSLQRFGADAAHLPCDDGHGVNSGDSGLGSAGVSPAVFGVAPKTSVI